MGLVKYHTSWLLRVEFWVYNYQTLYSTQIEKSTAWVALLGLGFAILDVINLAVLTCKYGQRESNKVIIQAGKCCVRQPWCLGCNVFRTHFITQYENHIFFLTFEHWIVLKVSSFAVCSLPGSSFLQPWWHHIQYFAFISLKWRMYWCWGVPFQWKYSSSETQVLCKQILGWLHWN